MTTVRASRTAFILLITLALNSCANASSLEPGMKAVEKIRGRKFTRDVKHVAIDRSELTGHLREQMLKSTPYSLDDWGVILRSLQLVDTPVDDILPKQIGRASCRERV